MIEPNASMVKNITHDILPRIMDQYMILDTPPHPARSSIAALRTFFGIAILAGSCTLPITSLIFAPELFDQGAVIRAKVDEQTHRRHRNSRRHRRLSIWQSDQGP